MPLPEQQPENARELAILWLNCVLFFFFCCKPLLLMHYVIESKYSVYIDGDPGASMAEMIIRKIQIMLTSITVNHSIIQFSLLRCGLTL